MGRQGLAVFATGSLLAVAAQLVRVPLGGGVVLDVVLVSAGLVILVLLAGGLEWLKRSTAQTSARTATPARTTVTPARTAPAAPSAAVPPTKAFGPVRA